MAGLTPGEGFGICFLFSQIFPEHKIGGAEAVRGLSEWTGGQGASAKLFNPLSFWTGHRPPGKSLIHIREIWQDREVIRYLSNTKFFED